MRKRKAEVVAAERVLETKYAVKQYSLQELGKGKGRGGGASGRKKRFEVLDRISRSCGQGLSPAQQNDYAWWKDAWDAKMLGEHQDGWPEVFAGWMQQVIAECENGMPNAFSVFMNSETRRCFDDGTTALRVPGTIKTPNAAA